MAKTSDGISHACNKLEIQPGAAGAWYDISTEMGVVSNTKETRATGSIPVYGDDHHVMAAGKKEPMTVTFTGVATEDATEAFERVRVIWETAGCSKLLAVRWSPKGGSVGEKQYKMTTNPQLVGFQYPAPSAAEGGPIPFEFDVFGYIETDTVAS